MKNCCLCGQYGKTSASAWQELSASWANTNIADLATEYFCGHDDQGIVGKFLPQPVRTVSILGSVIFFLVRGDEMKLEILLKKVEDKFGEEFNVLFLFQHCAVGMVGKMEL